MPRWTWTWTLRVVGLAGIAYEALGTEKERPTLLVLYGAMIGLPAFLRMDERRNGKKDS